MKKIKKLICLCVGLILVLSLTFNSTSATASTNGNTETRTITVVTKSNWWKPGGESITLSNSKVEIQYKTGLFSKKIKTKNIYPSYKITVSSTDGTHRYKKTMSGSSLKLSLKRNKTYKITVSYDSTGTSLKWAGKADCTMKGSPYWCVKKTNKVSACY